MAGQPNLVARLFWTAVVGGGCAFAFGQPALMATGVVLLLVVLHRLGRAGRFRRLARRLARRHARTLALRRRQECFTDAYGNEVRDGWLRERAYFVERTLVPALEAKGFGDMVDDRFEDLLALAEGVAAEVHLPDETATPDDGIGYEQFCLSLLARAGWRAHPTPASGDQGADIVAERDRVRLVVQCKRYGKPVGNAAVQEAAAAGRYWSGDMAAVVSNAGFTPAARKLAAATGVLLLHHDDLSALPSARPGRRIGGV